LGYIINRQTSEAIKSGLLAKFVVFQFILANTQFVFQLQAFLFLCYFSLSLLLICRPSSLFFSFFFLTFPFLRVVFLQTLFAFDHFPDIALPFALLPPSLAPYYLRLCSAPRDLILRSEGETKINSYLGRVKMVTTAPLTEVKNLIKTFTQEKLCIPEISDVDRIGQVLLKHL